ncbi:MAG: MFS transporter [Planctomycetota bacterium]
MSTSQNPAGVALRLSVMMFLQYAVWGAWLPVADRYISAGVDEGGLGFTGGQLGMILGLAGSVGALTAPFIAGQIADRYFRAERFLAFLMLLGGGLKWYTASCTEFSSWLWLSIAYSVVFMPTLALSNSIAFAHLRDAERQFPIVRVWGTVGWILVSWLFPMFWLQQNLSLGAMPPFLTGDEVAGVTSRLADALRLSGILAVVFAGYCLTLPPTPPKAESGDKLAFAAAFSLLRYRSFAVLVAVSLLIASIHQIYFIQTGPFFSEVLGIADSQIPPAKSIGQFSEVVIMAGLGGLLMRFGVRNVLMLGAAAYMVRYGIWALESLPTWVHVSSQVLHGVCYACFFATAFFYVDRLAPAHIRHSAQTVFGIVILGGGPVLGGWLQGVLKATYEVDGEGGFSGLWATLSGLGLAATVALLFLFRDESRGADPTHGDPEAEALAQETL